MATVKTESTGKYEFQRSNATPKTITVKPTKPPSAGTFGRKSTRTRYFSTSTGRQMSKTGRAVGGGRTSSLAKTIGKGPTPQTKAIGTGLAAKDKLKFPHADQRTSSGIGKAVNHAPILVAELLAAYILIGFAGISSIAKDGYQNAVSGIMLRFSAVTAIWFVLFLFTGSKRGGTFAAWLGFLVDLGILYDAVNKGAIADMTGIITGGGLADKTKLVSASEKPQEFYTVPEEVKAGQNV